MGYALVYDSGCGPCTRFKEAIEFLDARGRMRYVGLDEAEDQGLLATVPQALRRRSFHLVADDGSSHSGSGAFAALSSQLPGGALSSAALRTGPVSRAAGFAYVALSRLHGKSSCSIPQERGSR